MRSADESQPIIIPVDVESTQQILVATPLVAGRTLNGTCWSMNVRNGPAAYGFLRKTQRRFRERRYMEANAEGGEQVDGNGDEDENEEAAHGGAVGWKEKWVRLLSFTLARGVAGLIIRRAVGRCPAGSGWR
ncbi:hypothetical protein CYMTET_29948 [Cymbomonas tetramitiformis]|uniref:Uncharacterized protein n=1 Tax=Cymbomonas tetramitiformis TaxID=36881 RepID=A0AAE0FK23_9CHLO|nr:hypothetical protein CYMTET_29948 [Cymbomonas tetramitiformis]